MPVSLRVVLHQLVDGVDADSAEVGLDIVRALIATAPTGCDVRAIVPADAEGAVADAPGLDKLGGVTTAPLALGKLAAAWRFGLVRGVGGGLVHAPSLMAPLVRHDRVNENDQTVVTLWDLCAWERPDQLPRSWVSWIRAMLKRAERHADAVVVPTHAMAERLAELSSLGGRLRVIPGAAPIGFAVPTDAVGRRRELLLPEEAVVIAGTRCDDAALAAGLSAVASLEDGVDVVVLDVPEGQEPRVAELAEEVGVSVSRVHSRGALAAPDRAAVLDSARALVAPSSLSAFPWRVVEAMALGVPVVAVASDVHREVLLDGGLFVSAAQLGEALSQVLHEDERRRFSVRSADRGRAFSWQDHADRVWQLHAEL